jgi:SAM-dependent methyltransferase
MLALARATLGEAELSRVTVRQGDLHRNPFDAATFDVAVMHHVLHLLDDPAAALADARRLLRPGGRLLVVDFAPHELEQLQELHGHRCLGIGQDDLLDWAVAAGLELDEERTLPPVGPGEQLTVRLWLLRARAQPSAAEPPVTTDAAPGNLR